MVAIAIALVGCSKSPEAVPFPIIIKPQHLPIPRECRASARRPFPKLVMPPRDLSVSSQNVPGEGEVALGTTDQAAASEVNDEPVFPLSALEQRWLDARAGNDDNASLDLLCECFIVAEIGTDADKTSAAPTCNALRTHKP